MLDAWYMHKNRILIVRFVAKYLNSTTVSKELLSIFIL